MVMNRHLLMENRLAY